MSFAKSIVVFLAAVASANGLVTGHVARHNVHHRSIAARVAEPQDNFGPVPVVRRGPDTTSRKRCKPRLSFISPSPSATPSQAPVNVAPLPVISSSSIPPPPPSPSTSSTRAAPTPTPTPTPTPAPSPKPPAVNLPSFMVGTQTGQGTFYDTGLGACGIVNKDTDYIAAVSHLLFDRFPGYAGGNPNKNPICGRKVNVRFQGKTVTVAITDRCQGCAVTDLDFSPSAFAQLSDFGAGRINNIQWDWLD